MLLCILRHLDQFWTFNHLWDSNRQQNCYRFQIIKARSFSFWRSQLLVENFELHGMLKIFAHLNVWSLQSEELALGLLVFSDRLRSYCHRCHLEELGRSWDHYLGRYHIRLDRFGHAMSLESHHLLRLPRLHCSDSLAASSGSLCSSLCYFMTISPTCFLCRN